jgi:hypothetical protein
MNTFDIFLPCAKKDYNKLPYVIDAIVRNVGGFHDIVICSPTCLPEAIQGPINLIRFAHGGIHCVNDADVLKCDRSLWKYRPNWCFQQHLKLFQNVTHDWFVTLDCDTIINRPMKFWEFERPIWYKGWDQIYPPYFDFNKKILDLDRIDTRSFVADMNFFYRPLIQEMLECSGYTADSFIAKSQEITTDKCHMAEPELFGQYCLKYHPDFYHCKILKQAPMAAKSQDTPEESLWTYSEIVGAIEQYKGHDIDTFSIHSWYTGECR